MNNYQFENARKFLTDYMIRKAARLSRDLGMSYDPVPDAPGTYEDLVLEWNDARKNCRGLRVFEGASENTVYTNREGNWAFRFWHDVIHIARGLDFSTASEIAVANFQIATLQREYPSAKEEIAVLTADTVGQTMYYAKTGKFVPDQLAFVRSALDLDEVLA